MLSKSTRILHIDAWRFIAITMVIISHVSFSNPWYREHLPWMIMGRLPGLGQFGVKIFFCISGFVICRGLLSEKKNYGTVSMKAFYVRRLLRILPPVLLYMLALSVLTLLGMIHVLAEQLTYAGLFLCNFNLGKCGWLLAHTWSLAYEEQFYVFFPIVFVISTVFGGRKTVLALTILMTCASMAVACAGLDVAAFAIATFTCMLAGCVAAMYWDDIGPAVTHMSIPAWLGVTAVSCIIGCLVELPRPLGAIVSVLVLPTAVCAMVLGTPIRIPAIGKFFLHPTITYLGKISFTIYLWQQLATAPEFIQRPWLNFVALAGTVVIGILSYRYMERPLMAAGSAYSKRMLSAEAPSVPAPGSTAR